MKRYWIFRADCTCGYKGHRVLSEHFAIFMSWWHRFISGHTTRNTTVAIVGERIDGKVYMGGTDNGEDR